MSVALDQLRIYIPDGATKKELKHIEALTGRRVTESCKGRHVIQTRSIKEREHIRRLLSISRG